MKRFFDIVLRLSHYNVKIVFGNKFVYFVLSAVLFYILTVVINLFSDSEIMESDAYGMLLVPSILLIFYPMCFGIQNDQDAKIIEIIFGIPDYRYKVWLFRLLIAYVICFAITLVLALLTDWLLVEVPPVKLTYQVMMPVLFVGTLCFMLSTIVKNGSGTAVVFTLIGLVLFIMSSVLEESKWNLFLNPFDVPLDKNPELFYTTLLYNRIILLVGTVIFVLSGLYKTQNREKFI
ncbi:hypothetical protein [Odoribacter lunatus]|uniref:hypothetical protein n=1 Tax=Odoribacter lunatus TaxID=2941335 RepID=UPI00204059FE|nr:hypothetical protein [Odoribacter lunatus]